jgi:hypothetical protein
MDQNQARKHLSWVQAHGTVIFSSHALAEMKADAMKEGDVLNVMRGGKITEPAEHVKDSWRYRVHSPRFSVVVAFDRDEDGELVVVVTAWRRGR